MNTIIKFQRKIISSLILAILSLNITPTVSHADVPVTFIEHILDDQVVNCRSIYVFDIDLDTKRDIVSSGSGGIDWYKNFGGGEFSNDPILISAKLNNLIQPIDIEPDNDIDIVAASGTSTIDWWKNNGSLEFEEQFVDYLSPYQDGSLLATDLDNDGDGDILASQHEYGKIVLWKNDGAEIFSPAIEITNDFGSAIGVDVADINNDGYNDILGTNGGFGESKGEIAWWENNQSDEFPTKYHIDRYEEEAPAVLVDIDKDGNLDILGGGSNAPGSISWWKNDGYGNFLYPRFVAETPISEMFLNSIMSADIDHDGKMDVVGLFVYYGSSGRKLVWFRNTGDEVFSNPIEISQRAIVSVNTADIDDDGDIDIIGCGGDYIFWWEQEGNPPPEIIEDAVTAGWQHSCGLTPDGGAMCWGGNNFGQLGDGTTTASYSAVDVIDLSSGLTDIVSGNYHTCSLSKTGGVECWGSNGYGQLGDGTTSNWSFPIPVSGLSSGVSEIAAGNNHTCALIDGGVKCWGRNYYGQLGNDSTINSPTAVDVLGLASGVTDISAGGDHTCALIGEDVVKCWGRNYFGQLGDSTTIDRDIPVEVVGLSSGIRSVAAGGAHTCALKTDGGVECWGYNANGQLGDGTTISQSTPVSALISGVYAINAGSGHNCAIVAGGGVKCWGYNGYGQIGDGTTADHKVPVAVITRGITAIAGGMYHTCARTTARAILCWGWNGYGQLGDDTISDRYEPVNVIGILTGPPGKVTGSIQEPYYLTGMAYLEDVTISAGYGYETDTDTLGEFTLALPPGTWDIEFSKPDYHTVVHECIDVFSEEETKLHSPTIMLSYDCLSPTDTCINDILKIIPILGLPNEAGGIYNNICEINKLEAIPDYPRAASLALTTLVDIAVALLSEIEPSAMEHEATMAMFTCMEAKNYYLLEDQYGSDFAQSFSSSLWNFQSKLPVIALLDEIDQEANVASALETSTDLHIYSGDNHLGLVNDYVEHTIPGSYLFHLGDRYQIAIIKDINTDSQLVVKGQGIAPYALTVINTQADGTGTQVSFDGLLALDIQAILDLSPTTTDFTLDLDNDGDGIVDGQVQPSQMDILTRSFIYLPMIAH